MNEHGHDRGLHIVLIDPNTGKVAIAQIFDTYDKDSQQLDRFICNDRIPSNYIIAAACKDECTKTLSEEAILWFEAMGA